MLAGLEDEDERQPGRAHGKQAPVLVRPDVLLVARLAAATVDTALAVPGLLALDRRLKLSRRQLAVERERVPLLDRRHAERVLDALVELFGSLGHGSAMLTRVEWPEAFYELRRGEGCPMCEQGRPDETDYGVRILAGEVADAYLQKDGGSAGTRS